jgi:membrane-associated phospholipid phosphatase
MAQQPKREVPSALKKVLEWDIKLSKEVVELVNRRYPIATYRTHLKSLEVSCHGILWLIAAVAGIYATNFKEVSVNLLIGLVMDIAIVAVLKALTRRRRPAYDVDDQVATIKIVDKFSFPSGHATRAIMLAVLFSVLSPLPLLAWVPFTGWALAVAASRVLLGRHHILDVVAGVVLGAAEGVLLGLVWRSEEQAAALVTSALGSEDPWSSG